MAYNFTTSDDGDERGHGGGCCGITNFYGFIPGAGYEDYGSVSDALAEMGANRLAEIVLVDSQMGQMPDLVRDMKAAGFVLVNRFRNSNSGNICNVFHHVPRRESMMEAPGWGTQAIEMGDAGLAAPVVVHRTYHNRYRDGRVGAGYDTEADARAARRGTGPVVQRTFYSDGGRDERDLPAR